VEDEKEIKLVNSDTYPVVERLFKNSRTPRSEYGKHSAIPLCIISRTVCSADTG
jgi:hypothetical protein